MCDAVATVNKMGVKCAMRFDWREAQRVVIEVGSEGCEEGPSSKWEVVATVYRSRFRSCTLEDCRRG